ncbi:hypothetical protein R1sor_009893 [Riccia sorocarpa]|uniref:EamA domain-containing protein n=1 Tax=Riccia sorocarpa TaxID=122646 RepID=A0ABD3I012_9MARC
MERSELPFSISWRWITGVVYIISVALIWITASFVVQSVVDGGVSPFLITYICNSLFVVYIPIVEGGNKLKSLLKQNGLWQSLNVKAHDLHDSVSEAPSHSEKQNLLNRGGEERTAGRTVEEEVTLAENELGGEDESREVRLSKTEEQIRLTDIAEKDPIDGTELETLEKKDETWSRKRTALVGFVAVALGDSQHGASEVALKPVWGDLLTLISAMFYAVYTALIRAKISDEDEEKGNCSTALVLGYLGLFNAVFFGPIALILHFSGVEPFHRLTLTQVGLIVGKGLLDNVLSDYLWAKAVLLTSPTVATAGLTIQVPIAAVVDSFRGIVPAPANVLGAIMVLIGFFGINRSPVTEEDEEKLPEGVREGSTSTIPATSSV